jgi:hypothetical protein
MLESEALDFTARIERISEGEELGACFAPTTDRPQRLIESAARLNTNTRIADLIPDVSPTPLQQRIQRAFFLLRIKAGQWGNKSPGNRAMNGIETQSRR